MFDSPVASKISDGTDPPAQTTRADLKTGRPYAGDSSPPPKTNLGGSDGGFSSSKLDIPDSTDETHERKPEFLDPFRFIDISMKSGRARKKQKVAEPHSTAPGDASARTPPRPTGGIVIREPQTEAGTGGASSSQVAPAWEPKFLLDGKPLPSTASVRIWDKGEGGRIAQTLAGALQLPEDVHAFEDGSEESVGRRLEWHAIAAAQLAHIVAARARELDEENEREKAAREAAVKTAKEKAKIAESAENKAAAAEKFRASAEQRCADLLARQNETELKLAQALSLNTSHAEEIADLRAGLAAAEQKWYDVGFADAENSAEPVVARARHMGFEAGWYAAL
ncbi:uncharacterized protein LOC126698732 [Quercus robur]|uniref:uncharacterized protein LOC126698732 n=1 Tax=Quercus robur TaxID=38942 RepID=UPI0021620D2D|nr:uncharacterized protein LOC126698732 [Quercus robur]